MTDFTRLTIVGTARRAELVVPDDESMGALIPRLMDLLGEPSGPLARPLTLVRATGEQLDAALSAAEQRLMDGEQLRLVRADEAPPPPEVADVTDVVSDSWGDRPGRWSSRSREATGAVAVGALACVALLMVPGLSAVISASILAVALLVAVGLGRASRRWGSIAFTAAACGLALPSALNLLAAAADAPPRPELVVAVTVSLVWLCLGFGVGLGLGRRAVLAGSAAGIVLTMLPVLLAASGLQAERAIALGAVVASVVCGLLPWYALASSGLTGLDDQVLTGRLGERRQVLRSVEDAYRSLNWATFALAVPLTGTALLLVRSDRPWTLALGIAVTVLAALRTRAFPLALQQLPLWLGAAAATVVCVVTRRPELAAAQVVAVLAGLVAAILVMVGLQPAPHVRARLRRLGNLVEALAVIALVPLLLGVFGIYSDLLGGRR